jgi:GDPmannose 4,6-dehydratase
MKSAVISGISGQDGAYLTKFLIENKYKVIGLTRSSNNIASQKFRYLGINEGVYIEECDLLDFSSIIRLIEKYQPDEFYNLAAQSSVASSFHQPIGTINFNIHSVLNVLEAIRLVSPKTKYYQASSSEMYGHVSNLPITEETVLNPLSPYGISKASGHWIVRNYRDSYGVFASSGILFNHESFLRENTFFVKKVIQSAIQIKNGKQKNLYVGNIDIKRDFGYAPEYIKAMHLIIQHEIPDDFIICSGESIFLRDVINYVFEVIGISINKVIVDPKLFRPTEILDIYGSNEKAKSNLNWNYDLRFFDVLDLLIREEIDAQDKSVI